MRNKFVTALLIVTLICTFSACGKKSDSGSQVVPDEQPEVINTTTATINGVTFDSSSFGTITTAGESTLEIVDAAGNTESVSVFDKEINESGWQSVIDLNNEATDAHGNVYYTCEVVPDVRDEVDGGFAAYKEGKLIVYGYNGNEDHWIEQVPFWLE